MQNEQAVEKHKLVTTRSRQNTYKNTNYFSTQSLRIITSVGSAPGGELMRFRGCLGVGGQEWSKNKKVFHVVVILFKQSNELLLLLWVMVVVCACVCNTW